MAPGIAAAFAVAGHSVSLWARSAGRARAGAERAQEMARYLVEHEFAHDQQDILWRRTKLGLHLTPDDATRLQAWLNEEQPAVRSQALP